MKPTSSELKQFTSEPWWYRIRGTAMILTGGVISGLCLIAPNVYMLGESFSWIPIVGIVIFLLGCLRCIDAFTSESLQGFLLNMQGGILDLVIGFLVLFSINDEPDNLHLLIVGYMLTQGIYRNVLLSAVDSQNPMSNRITGVISITLGLLIWMDWPTSATWFLALSLSIDVSFRGWALLMLASALNKASLNNGKT